MTYHTRADIPTTTRWPTPSRSATATTARCSARPTPTATTCGAAGSATTAGAAARSSPTPRPATTGRPTRSGWSGPASPGRSTRTSAIGLDAAGSWGWTKDPYIGNYGDNSLLYFHQYQNAQPGKPLADRAKTGTSIRRQGRDPEALLADFRATSSTARCRRCPGSSRPRRTPSTRTGSRLRRLVRLAGLDILAANPEVWSKMALFITYDEEGGFFDHVVAADAAADARAGAVDRADHQRDLPGRRRPPGRTYGLGRGCR